ncbi:MAG: DUF2288 family protein [Polyangiaceae bacterium]|nr:DUF2288 family protein [Polyangiaceae bacterium]
MTDDRTLEGFESAWDALSTHEKRGALFLVEPGLDPAGVARAIAEDDVDEVKRLLESGNVRRPSREEAELWSAAPADHRFRFYIVQPYVIAQRVG